ncbi:unnamed protein product, partial [Prunus brigantina]
MTGVDNTSRDIKGKSLFCTYCEGKNSLAHNAQGTSISKCHVASFHQSSKDWIIDSGATDHITSSPDLLHTSASHPSSVELPNGSRVDIISTGSLKINSDLVIKDVLSVPSFNVNLLSVSKITRDLHCTIIFHPGFCILQDLTTKKVIGLGKEHNGLYYLTKPTDIKPPPAAHTTSTNSDLWHRRLGHPSAAPLQFLSKSVYGIPFNLNSDCEICPMAKQTRLPFSSSSISTLAPFDLIHCDI